MAEYIFTCDGVFFSPIKEEVVRIEAEILINKLVEKSTIQRGFDDEAYIEVKISFKDFQETVNEISNIKVIQFKQIS